jgi:branched-chain amino acid transport system substrate-binding protein
MMRRRFWVLAALASIAAVVSLQSASAMTRLDATPTATPGVTKGQIVIGGTFPLSGVASLYAPIPRGMEAYFKYINARKGKDGKRGVGGRQIVWKYYDDTYNPATAVRPAP